MLRPAAEPVANDQAKGESGNPAAKPEKIRYSFFPNYNAEDPSTPLKAKNLSHSIFDDLNAHGRHLENCDLSYSIFRRGYFRDAQFRNCSFKGCRFEDCSFRGAELYQCDFAYATFSQTVISPKEIIANLPDRPNQKRELLQVLRANAASLGDYDAQSAFVLEEAAASRDHYKRIFLSKESHYQQKYGRLNDRVSAWFSYTWLGLDGFLWGHGEKPAALILSSLSLMLACATANLFDIDLYSRSGFGAAIIHSMLYCFNTFMDIPADKRFHGYELVDVVLVGMRYIFLGLFVGVVAKRLSHR